MDLTSNPKPDEAGRAKPVLLVPGHPASAAWWPGLAESYRLCFLYPQAAPYAVSIGISEATALADSLDANAHEHALNATAHLTAQVVGALGSIGPRVSAIAGPDAPHELNGQFTAWWGGFMLHHLRERSLTIAALEHLAQQEPLAGCVTHEDVTVETRTLVLFCQARGLPTIHIPHANCHLRPDGGPDIHRESISDWLCAAGPYMQRWYATNGYPAERIILTGAPNLDELYENEIPARNEARQALSLREEERVIAYASTWMQTTGLRGGWDAEIQAGFGAVLDLAKRWDARLIVKIHPHAQGTDEVYAQALRAAGVGGLVTRLHGHYTLRAADVIVAQGPSNLCVEAAILGTPSVYLRTEGFDYEHELPYRCDPADLPIAAEAALASRDDPRWQDFIAEYNAAHPAGGASARVAEVVKEKCWSSVSEPTARSTRSSVA